MPLYIVESIDLPCLSFSSLMDELIGVPIAFTFSILNLLKRSLMYLSWLMKVSSFSYLI